MSDAGRITFSLPGTRGPETFEISAPGLTIHPPSGPSTADAFERSIRTAARKACADLVRAAGCLCDELNGSLECMADWDDNGQLENHDPRCPIVLAAAIERGEKVAP